MNENIESLKQQVLKEMRNPILYTDKIKIYVEDYIDDSFGICCRKNLSINEKYPDSKYAGQLGQKTVFLTVKMFDLWETAVVEVLSEHISLKFPGIKILPINDPVGDLMIVFPDGEEMRWEIKSSQAKDSFTGATHSASKCNNYILINYSINRNQKLKLGLNNKGFISEMAVFVWDNMEAEWSGEHTEHSSFTTLRIPANIKQTRPEIIVVGGLEPHRLWSGIVREKSGEYALNSKRYSKNIPNKNL